MEWSSSGQEPTHLPRWEEVARRKPSERQVDTVTPQTVMRVEFHPASNMAKHGKWRFYGMPIDNIELL